MEPSSEPSDNEPSQTVSDDQAERILLACILGGILALFIAGYISRSSPAPIGVSNAGSQFIFECPNGERMMCPIGTLEPTGPIEDDT